MECDAFESDTHIKGKPEWIFTENNTNQERLYHVKNACMLRDTSILSVPPLISLLI